MEGRVMGIYIKGFKPQDGLYVIKDGAIRKYKGNGGTVRPYELVEVKEPHGRLIDADAICKKIETMREEKVMMDDYTFGRNQMADIVTESIEDAPVIIEGSE